MIIIVKEPGSPDNAFHMENFIFPYTKRVEVSFFHPNWPSIENDGIPPGEFRTCAMTLDLENAIKLRDLLNSSIEILQSENKNG